MSHEGVPNQAQDQRLVEEILRCQSALQRAVHEAVEAGLKVTVTIESMHPVGDHCPEPLVEATVERVIKLT